MARVLRDLRGIATLAGGKRPSASRDVGSQPGRKSAWLTAAPAHASIGHVPLWPSVIAAKWKSGWRMLVREPRRLRNLIRFDTYVVFSARADDVASRSEPEGVTFRQLTAAEVRALTPVDEDISDAMERCGYVADTAAFGAFYYGAFAHISWMIAGGPDSDSI